MQRISDILQSICVRLWLSAKVEVDWINTRGVLGREKQYSGAYNRHGFQRLILETLQVIDLFHSKGFHLFVS
jgi:hypothetical protein